MKDDFRLYKAAFENTNEGICVVSTEGEFIKVNKQFCTHLGYQENELVGMHFNDVTHPDDLNVGSGIVKDLLSGDVSQIKSEKRYLTKTGEIFYALVSTTLKRDEGGEPEYFITHIFDIGDRVRAEKQFANIFNSMLDGYALHEIIVDDEGTPVDYRFLQINPSFERLTGLRAKDLIGRTVLEVMPNTEKAWIEKYGHVALTGEPLSFESYSVELDRHYKVSAYSPNAGEFAVVFTDISDRVTVEEELREARDKAESASKIKNEFLANMSHEIRTPLNGVLGMLQLIQTTELDNEQGEYVDIGIRSARSLLRILADILDLSRIEAGKMDIVSEEFLLADVLKPVVEAFKDEAASRKVELVCTCDKMVPQHLIGDPVRIRQILYNLVGNAVKFTERGIVSLEVVPMPLLDSESTIRIHFLVADTGIGIDNTLLPNLFNSFTQADGSTTRKYGGTGLGLSMVQRLVGLMGGTIQVFSTQGEGTEMHVSLDLQLVPESNDTNTEPSTVSAECAGYSILLVEDDRVNSISVKRLLQKKGHQVECVENGQEALDALITKTYDCILMDIQMPVLDGEETTRIIRRDESYMEVQDIPIIALTAHAMAGDRERFLRIGMNDYVAKPVDITNLLETLSEVM